MKKRSINSHVRRKSNLYNYSLIKDGLLENTLFVGDFPIESPISSGFPRPGGYPATGPLGFAEHRAVSLALCHCRPVPRPAVGAKLGQDKDSGRSCCIFFVNNGHVFSLSGTQ